MSEKAITVKDTATEGIMEQSDSIGFSNAQNTTPPVSTKETKPEETPMYDPNYKASLGSTAKQNATAKPVALNPNDSYDWFVNDISGNIKNMADMFQEGVKAEQFNFYDIDKYWNDDEIRKPFEEQFGAEEGKKRFEEVYENSKFRYEAYRDTAFDISATSVQRLMPTPRNLYYEQLGGAKTYKELTAYPNRSLLPPIVSAEGRKISYGIVGKPQHSIRAAANDNGVLVDGELIKYDEYKKKSDAPLVYAKDENGQYKFINGKAYLRPLAEGEEKKYYEEYFNIGSDKMGLNGLVTPDWYVAKTVPQNVGNFVYSLVDGTTEILKTLHTFAHGNDAKETAYYKAVVDFENYAGKYLNVSHTDQALADPWSAEAVTSSIIQAAGQIALMYATFGAGSALANVAKLGKYSGEIGKAFSSMTMATIASPGLKEAALAAGLSQKEAAAIHAITFLGYMGVSQITNLLFEGNPALKKMMIDATLKNELGSLAASKATAGALNTASTHQLSKNIIANYSKNLVKLLKTSPKRLHNGVLQLAHYTGNVSNKLAQSAGAGTIEAMEEASEAIMEHGIKYMYDNIYQPIAKATDSGKWLDTNYDTRFDATWDQLKQEMLLGATIGFVAGAGAKRFFLGNKDIGLHNDYYKHIAAGDGKLLYQRLEKLHKSGALANNSINAEGKRIKKGEESRNDIAYKLLKKDLDVANAVWESNGLGDAYKKTEEKLYFLRDKELNSTSIGRDLANSLEDVDKYMELNAELSKQEDTEENRAKIEEHNKLIKKAKQEIVDIRDGKRASKYYHEVMYNVSDGDTKLDFNTFYNLNEEHKRDVAQLNSDITTAKESETKSVEELEDKDIITPERAAELTAEIDEAYPEELDMETMEAKRDDKHSELFNKIQKSLANFEKIKDRTPTDIFFKGFNPTTFKAGKAFKDIISDFSADLNAAETEGDTIFDNVEAIDDALLQVETRLHQLNAAVATNPLANEGHRKLGEKESEIELSQDDAKAITKELINYYSKLSDFKTIATKSRLDFGVAIKKANNIYIDTKITRLEGLRDFLVTLNGEFALDEVIDTMGKRLLNIAASDSYLEKELEIMQLEQEIHTAIGSSAPEFMAYLYELHGFNEKDSDISGINIGLNLGVAPITQRKAADGTDVPEGAIHKSTLRYLKTIIENSPNDFYSRYETILNNIPTTKSDELSYTKARHIPSPQQRTIIQQITSFLSSNIEQPTIKMEKGSFKAVLTESIFLASYQGSGKTIMSAWAAKIDQTNRGGKVLVLANDETNKVNMAETMKGLGVNLTDSASVTVEGVVDYLQGDIQKDINLITIDEATLIPIETLERIDTMVKAINAKRKGSKLKVLYTGDPMQVGAVDSTGEQSNISSSSKVIVQTTDEVKFSFRSGNDQINNLLEFQRAKMWDTFSDKLFTGKYNREEFSGTNIQEGEDFDKELDFLMSKLTDEQDYIIIAEDTKHSAIKNKYKLKDNKILTPQQAQGKQWDIVITDLDTSPKMIGEDSMLSKNILSTIGRAKNYLLMRVDNTQKNNKSRGLYSTPGDTVNVTAQITEDLRQRFLEEEKGLMSGMNFAEPINNETNINTKVNVTPPIKQTVIETIAYTPLTPKERNLFVDIFSKVQAELKNRYSDKLLQNKDLYIPGFSYFTVGWDADKKANKDVSSMLAMKRMLLYPNGNDEKRLKNVSFSLAVHDGSIDSAIQTQVEGSKKLPPIKPTDKRIVIYANMDIDGKNHTMSVMTLLRPELLGLKQSDLFDVKVPFNSTQNKLFLEALRSPREGESVTKRSLANPKYSGNESVSIQDFIDRNKELFNFSSQIWYQPKGRVVKGEQLKEKQTYLIYSPSLSTAEIDNLMTEDPSRIESNDYDLKRLLVDGGNVTPNKDALLTIKDFAVNKETKVKPSDLPNLSPNTHIKVLNTSLDLLGISQTKKGGKAKNQTEKAQSISTAYFNTIIKKQDTFAGKRITTEQRVLLKAITYAFVQKPKGKRKSGKPFSSLLRESKFIKISAKNRITGKTTSTSQGKKEVFKPKSGDYIFDSIRIFQKLYKIIDSSTDKAEIKAAEKIIANLVDANFGMGFRTQVKTTKGSTGGGATDIMAPATNVEFKDFKITGITVPSMPAYNISLDFIKEVASENAGYSAKIKTHTEFVSQEVKKEPVTPSVTTPTGTSPASAVTVEHSLEIPKNVETDSNTNEWSAIENNDLQDESSNLYNLYRKYFDYKPYGHVFPKFIQEFERRVYNSLFNLQTSESNSPSIVSKDINKILTSIKQELKAEASEIDKKINEARLAGHDWNFRPLIENTEYHAAYFSYVMGKEFDSLLNMKFKGITVKNDEYRFKTSRFVDNQMESNKEKISHIERATSLVKMHIGQMPILSPVEGNKAKIIAKAGNNTVAELIREVRDVDISTVEKAREFMKGSSNPAIRSFYHRFLNPNSLTVINETGTEEIYHSFLNNKLNNSQEAEDIVTALLSFLATGKEAQYVKMNFSDNALMAKFTDIPTNRYRDNLELAIKAINNHENFTEDGNTMIIKYKRNKSGKAVTAKWELEMDDNGNVTLAKGIKGDIATIFNDVFGMPFVHWKQIIDVQNIADKQGRPLTYKIIRDIAKYASIPQGERPAEMFKGGDLTDWIFWADEFQKLKKVEGAYGYTNINGDSVNLITLTSPIIQSNQTFDSIIDDLNSRPEGAAPNVFVNNKFIKTKLDKSIKPKDYMKLEAYYLKEGYISDYSSKANSILTEEEQMVYDFKHLFLDSLRRDTAKSEYYVNGKSHQLHSAIYHPMVYADKSSDYSIRVTKQVILKDSSGNLDVTGLKSRTIENISSYNQMIGHGILKELDKALSITVNGIRVADKYGFSYDIDAHILSKNTPANIENQKLLKQKLTNFNKFLEQVNSMKEENRIKVGKALLGSSLSKGLAYDVSKSFQNFSGIKSGVTDSILKEDVAAILKNGRKNFIQQWNKLSTEIPALDISDVYNYDNLYNDVSKESLLELFFYNHMDVAHEFTTVKVGHSSQYKDVGDMTKRNPQISTQRQKFITRGKDYNPKIHGKSRGFKLGTTSKVATMLDFHHRMTSINYKKKHVQDIYDGAAFHNRYATIMMRNSYGNEAGFKVASTLKPISTNINYETGNVRFDKYASFEITPEMLGDKGHAFIQEMYKLQLDSVPFPQAIMDGAIDTGAMSLYQLEEYIMKKRKYTRAKDYDAIVSEAFDLMIENSSEGNILTDQFIQETIFTSSVKSGQSNLTWVNPNDVNNIGEVGKLNYMERSNLDRGLVLDASHNPEEHASVLPTQIVSTLLQGNFSTEEADNVLGAIAYIGDTIRNNDKTLNHGTYKQGLRDRINKRNTIGLISKMVNKPEFSFNSKTVKNELFSVIASSLSNETIRFKIKGGQQVVAPFKGVFDKIVTTDKYGNRTVERGRDLKGFDAFNAAGESIKTTEAWKNLVIVQDRKSEAIKANAPVTQQMKTDITEALTILHSVIESDFTTIQKPEVIIAPTLLTDLGIDKNTELEDIDFKYFKQRAENQKGKELRASGLTHDEVAKKLYEKATIDEINTKAKQKLIEFNRTLEVALIRIPATNKQSYMAVDVVGFAHDAENTFYTNLDVLYLQGADQDIDKGNLLVHEAYKGKVIIPNTLEEAITEQQKIYADIDKDENGALQKTLIPLKNFIVDQILKASKKPTTLLESTTPTTTSNIKSISNQKATSDNVDFYNPFTNATMFVRGQGGMKNVGIHAAGIRAYSALYHAFKKSSSTPKLNYKPESKVLKYANGRPISPEIKGLDFVDSIAYMDTLESLSELINAAVDNARDPILGTIMINGTTGGLVNTMLAFGYTTQQVVDFLFQPDVKEVFRKFALETLYNPDTEVYVAIEEIIGSVEQTKAIRDLKYFNSLSNDYQAIGSLTKITGEVPNKPFDLYRYIGRLDKGTPKGSPKIQEFLAMGTKERLQAIAVYDAEIEANKAHINLFKVIHYNPHLSSYLKSAVFTEAISKEMSTITNTIDGLAKSIETEDRVVSDKVYKEIDTFTYGNAVVDFLKANNTSVVLTINGISVTYDLTKVQGDATALGRVEFMRDFPKYFKGLNVNNPNNIKDYLTIEPYGKDKHTVDILKLESNFQVQTPEIQIAIISALESIEVPTSKNEKPDLIVPKGDTKVKQALWLYSLIKDKGGNSSTSITALFDDTDMKPFNDFLDGWDSKYLTRPTKEEFNSSNTAFIFAKWSKSLNKKTRKRYLKSDITSKRLPDQFNMFIPYDVKTKDYVSSEKLIPTKVTKTATVNKPTATFNRNKDADLESGEPYAAIQGTITVNQADNMTVGSYTHNDNPFTFVSKSGKNVIITSGDKTSGVYPAKADIFARTLNSVMNSLGDDILTIENFFSSMQEATGSTVFTDIAQSIQQLEDSGEEIDIESLNKLYNPENNKAISNFIKAAVQNTATMDASYITVDELSNNEYNVRKAGDTSYVVIDKYGKILHSHGLDDGDNTDPLKITPRFADTGIVDVTSKSITLGPGERLILSTNFLTKEDIPKFIEALSKGDTDTERYVGSKGEDAAFVVVEYSTNRTKSTEVSSSKDLYMDTINDLVDDNGHILRNLQGIEKITFGDFLILDEKKAALVGYDFSTDLHGNYVAKNSTLDAPFSKPSSIEYYNTKTKEKVYSKDATHSTIEGIINLINSNGGNVKVFSSQEIEANYGTVYSKAKGFVHSSGDQVINSDSFTLDTPIHEMGHVWIKALRYSNPDLYNTIIEESLSHEIVSEIEALYPELVTSENAREAIGEEVFAMLFGLNNQQKALDNYNAGFITKMSNTIKEFINWLNGWMIDNLGVNLRHNDTLGSVIDRAGSALLTSSFFNYSGKDFTVMRNSGINLNDGAVELNAIKAKLHAQGLISKEC